MTKQPPTPQPATSPEETLRLAVVAAEQLARRSEGEGRLEEAEEQRRVGMQIKSLVDHQAAR